MSNEELAKHMADGLKDELKDVIKYAEMSDKTHNYGYAQIFRDMAHEEYQHAHHIKSIISDTGIVIPNQNEIDMIFDKADKALREM